MIELCEYCKLGDLGGCHRLWTSPKTCGEAAVEIAKRLQLALSRLAQHVGPIRARVAIKTARCACRSDDSRVCFDIRHYGYQRTSDERDGEECECECGCHSKPENDYDE